MTITEFLLARIAEDSRLASEAKWAMQGAWFPSADDAVDALVQACSPDRALAECAAKRAIIEQAERSDSGWWESIYVAILAAVYADHPDYQPEYGTWRHVLNEEVAEAYAETGHELITELVQVAAVAIQWAAARSRVPRQIEVTE